MGLVVGVCGGSGSGKTTLTDRLVGRLGPLATRLSFDSYYRDLAHLPPAERAVQNFDHPDSLDAGLLARHLDELAAGRSIAVPGYDFARYVRTSDLTLVEPRPVVVVEGILLFAHPELVERLDLAVFRDCPEPVRFARRCERDVTERGRTPGSVLAQFEATVKPMHDRFVEPGRSVAHRVVTHGEDLDLVVDELAASIQRLVPAPA